MRVYMQCLGICTKKFPHLCNRMHKGSLSFATEPLYFRMARDIVDVLYLLKLQKKFVASVFSASAKVVCSHYARLYCRDVGHRVC